MDINIEAGSSNVIKNPSGKPIRSDQKLMILDYYDELVAIGGCSKTQRVKMTASKFGVSGGSIWKILNEMRREGIVRSPNRRRTRITIYDKLSEEQKNKITNMVHSFFENNETPTIDKIYQAIRDDETLPKLGRSAVWNLLKKLGFVWDKRASKYANSTDEEPKNFTSVFITSTPTINKEPESMSSTDPLLIDHCTTIKQEPESSTSSDSLHTYYIIDSNFTNNLTS